MVLTDLETCTIGVVCGVSDTTLLQSTNYWKNAQQQRMPFTIDPRLLYRGYAANTTANGLTVMSQFFLNGAMKRLLTGGVERPLSNGEKIFAGVAAGAVSSVIASPLELIMVQQQKHGGGLVTTARALASQGPATVFRGLEGMVLREGIYCGGYLGVVPVVRQTITERYPNSFGKTEDRARLCATFLAGPLCSFASHPPDTIKTLLQGDTAGERYRGYAQAVRSLVAERGVAALWSGLPWRVVRQFCAVFLFDKINSDLAPRLFPHSFS